MLTLRVKMYPIRVPFLIVRTTNIRLIFKNAKKGLKNSRKCLFNN